METSFANGGQLSASNAEVWNRWSTVLKGLARMLRNDAPVLVSPKLNIRRGGQRNLSGTSVITNTVAIARLAIAARNELFAMAEHERIDFDHERRGILHVYRTRRDYEHAPAELGKLAELACKFYAVAW